MNGNQKWPSYCERYEMNFHRRWKGDDGIYFGYRFWFHCLYEQNGFFKIFFHSNGVFGVWFQWFLLFCMIYCITVTCHCNTVELVKAHTNEYLFLHTFGFHKNCSALRERERERERELCCNGKEIKWRCRGSNPGPFTCKAKAVPLSYIAILEDRAFKKYIFKLTVAH